MKRLLTIALLSLIATPLVAQQMAGALLHCDSLTYSFGEVERSKDDIHHTFVIENRGDTPLIIKRVERSCSCMKVNLSKRPIAPGESREMRVTYEVRKMPEGLFSKVVQIYSNSVGDTSFMQFTITGRSVPSTRGKRSSERSVMLIDRDIEDI